MSKRIKKRISDALKELVGSPAPVEMLDAYPELVEQMAEGEPAPTIGRVIALKVLRYAMDGTRPNQWAVELVFDRVEGKAIQQQAGDGREHIEERLDDISRKHLDDLAAVAATSARASQAEGSPDGRVANPLDALPSHRARHPQGDRREPPLADGDSQAGGA